MKVKQLPEDFFVEELTNVRPLPEGDFAFYRLEKRGWTTPDALAVIRKRWKLDLKRFSFGGLKDRHAQTIQYLTIHHGPQRQLTHQGIRLECLGRLDRPYTSTDFSANRFRLAVRALDDATLEGATAELEDVRRDGLANYFDDQRFGSVSGREFMAKALVLGDFEKALKLALAATYEHDRAAQKREKEVLRSHWGDWSKCKARLPPGHTCNLIAYLAHHPNDFRGAIARLRPELRSLYLAAFQSHLWNRMLATWLRVHLQPAHLVNVDLRLGAVPMPWRVELAPRTALTSLELPLPTARGELANDDPAAAVMNAVLAAEGLTREQMKVKGLREVFFSKGSRPALCMPVALQCETGVDELNEGLKKLALHFDLPRGSYATLVVKRAFAATASSTV